ncbi:MAG TPA: Hsp20/alpha crystallin family protein [Tepidisphaeraceae bacterium]|jgi:HSP20 family protein
MPIIAATDPPFGNVSRPITGKVTDPLTRGYFGFAPSETWTPNVNLYETDTGYLVCVDLAGVEKPKIDITVEDHVLRVRGHRAVPTVADGAEGDLQQRRVRVHLMEIDHGSFVREVELPLDVQHDQINAHYRDGLLWIELPKKK